MDANQALSGWIRGGILEIAPLNHLFQPRVGTSSLSESNRLLTVWLKPSKSTLPLAYAVRQKDYPG